MTDASPLGLAPPIALSSVFGQDRAVAQLRGALGAGRLAHAYLFVGPEGVGKAATARALAAGLLCAQPPAPGDGCGRCADCAAVRRGDHPDLRLAGPPEGKRALPIALVQALGAELALRPARAARRVAIVHEADHCTEEAANALLKTLEEPPGSALCILIAVDAGALPTTIRSRCQVVRFGLLPVADIARALRAAGCNPLEADGRAERADGSLGAALRDDADAAAAARELFAPLPRPDGPAVWERAQAVLARCKAGAETAEAVRTALSTLLAARIRDERDALCSAVAGAAPADPAGHRAEARLRALLAARRAVRANGTPELVVETLLLQL